MDAKITLSFDREIIAKAKEYAAAHNISLSRLTEFLLRKATTKEYLNLEDYPISGWVDQVSDGAIEYRTRKSKKLKEEFFDSKK